VKKNAFFFSLLAWCTRGAQGRGERPVAMAILSVEHLTVHAFRAARRRAAVCRKDAELQDLKCRLAAAERELARWRSWWYSAVQEKQMHEPQLQPILEVVEVPVQETCSNIDFDTGIVDAAAEVPAQALVIAACTEQEEAEDKDDAELADVLVGAVDGLADEVEGFEGDEGVFDGLNGLPSEVDDLEKWLKAFNPNAEEGAVLSSELRQYWEGDMVDECKFAELEGDMVDECKFAEELGALEKKEEEEEEAEVVDWKDLLQDLCGSGLDEVEWREVLGLAPKVRDENWDDNAMDRVAGKLAQVLKRVLVVRGWSEERVCVAVAVQVMLEKTYWKWGKWPEDDAFETYALHMVTGAEQLLQDWMRRQQPGSGSSDEEG